MKTQITNLINGNKIVKRDLTNPKYLTATRSTSHDGYTGTPITERQKIAEKVFAENTKNIEIEIKGLTLILEKQSSNTSKTNWFYRELNANEYMTIMSKTELSKINGIYSYELTIHNDCTVEISVHRRKTKNAKPKTDAITYIDESFVIIK